MKSDLTRPPFRLPPQKRPYLRLRGCIPRRHLPQVQTCSAASTHSSTSRIVKEPQPASGRTLRVFFAARRLDNLPSMNQLLIRSDAPLALTANTVHLQARVLSA